MTPHLIASSMLPADFARLREDAPLTAGRQPILLEVGGGATVANRRALADSGADTLVAGPAIFGAQDAVRGYHGVIGAMREQLRPHRQGRAA